MKMQINHLMGAQVNTLSHSGHGGEVGVGRMLVSY
jgi:hypothetical protein